MMLKVILRSWNLKRTRYALFFLTLIFTMVIVFPKGVTAQAVDSNNENGLGIQARAALLVNADTGQLLYEYKIHEPLPHASITKVMTLIVAMDALDRGDIHLNDVVTVSQEASSVIGSRIWLNIGDKISVEDLMKAVAVPSANDAAYALAQHIAGSEKNFVKLMNQRAKDMGLKNTHFENSTGLDGLEHYSSAYDIYLQALEIVKEHPGVLDWTSKWLMNIEAKNYSYPNTNRLVNPYERYEGADGLKTGHTEQAQWCLVATAKRENVRLISVVLGADSEKSRIEQTKTLLDYGFNNFKSVTYEVGQSVGTARIPLARNEKVQVVLDETFTVLIPKIKKQEELSTHIELLEGLNAPINKGDGVGYFVVKDGDKELGRGKVLAAENAERVNILVRLLRWLRDLINSLIDWN